MHATPGTVHVNKIAAAKRQLDLAIRLFFAKEDELGIHTLGSAAFTILRNVFKTRRGYLFTQEILRNGFYDLARQYAEGRIPKEKLALYEKIGWKPAFEEIMRAESRGERFDLSRINIPMKNEERAFPSRAAGFLKHATKDPNDYLAVDTLKNEDVLIGACTAYLEIMRIPSPEITAFCAFWAVKNNADNSGDVEDQYRELLLKLKSVDEPARYQLCAEFIHTTYQQPN